MGHTVNPKVVLKNPKYLSPQSIVKVNIRLVSLRERKVLSFGEEVHKSCDIDHIREMPLQVELRREHVHQLSSSPIAENQEASARSAQVQVLRTDHYIVHVVDVLRLVLDIVQNVVYDCYACVVRTGQEQIFRWNPPDSLYFNEVHILVELEFERFDRPKEIFFGEADQFDHIGLSDYHQSVEFVDWASPLKGLQIVRNGFLFHIEFGCSFRVKQVFLGTDNVVVSDSVDVVVETVRSVIVVVDWLHCD
jgi:hypothetical protein